MCYKFSEDEEVALHFKFGDKIDNAKISNNKKNSLPISFFYAKLDGDYGFNSLSDYDSKFLVEKLILFSTNAIDRIIDDCGYELHLHRSDKSIFKEKIKDDYKCSTKIECMPDFFHFALYTNEKASRKTGVKSPRIHFFVGNQSIIYLLYYDAYHELC